MFDEKAGASPQESERVHAVLESLRPKPAEVVAPVVVVEVAVAEAPAKPSVQPKEIVNPLAPGQCQPAGTPCLVRCGAACGRPPTGTTAPADVHSIPRFRGGCSVSWFAVLDVIQFVSDCLYGRFLLFWHTLVSRLKRVHSDRHIRRTIYQVLYKLCPTFICAALLLLNNMAKRNPRKHGELTRAMPVLIRLPLTPRSILWAALP